MLAGLVTFTWRTSASGVAVRFSSLMANSATERQVPMSRYDFTFDCASWLPTMEVPRSVAPCAATKPLASAV